MKIFLTLYRIVLILFAIGILVVASLSVIPLVQGDVSVEGAQDDIDWDIQGEELVGDTNITIVNSGNFNLEDIKLDVQLKGAQGLRINMTKKLNQIEVGERRKAHLKFSKDLTSVTSEAQEQLIYNDTDLKMSVKFQGQYTYALMTFNVKKEDTLFWRRLVNEIEYDIENGEIASGPSLVVPLNISTNDNDFISGDVSFTIHLLNEGETKEYSTSEFVMELGEDFSSALTFDITEEDSKELMTTSQDLITRTEIALEDSGFSTVDYQNYQWGAPLNNFAIEDVSPQVGRFSANVSFTNDGSERLDFSLRCILDDPNGDEIGRSVSNHSVAPGTAFREMIVVEFEDDEEPSEVVFEIENERTGAVYREVMEL